MSSSTMLNRSQQWDSQMVQTRSSQEVLIMISRCGTSVRMRWRWNYKGTRKQSPACSLAQTGLTFLQILWIALWGSGICALMHPRYIVHFHYLLPSEVLLLLCFTTRDIRYCLLLPWILASDVFISILESKRTFDQLGSLVPIYCHDVSSLDGNRW